MAPDSCRSLREELPAHAGWIRRLARSLVRDDASADDLSQEAALAALQRAAVPSALRPWLARVVRNFAHRSARATARRTAREAATARPEATPEAADVAARLELERRLVDALAALEPALRHVVVRRYLDGWSSARIARETGEPAATVRWRLQRGLAELRARLGASSDGRDWRLALLPLCAAPPPWAGLLESLRPLLDAAVFPGALIMKAASQVLAAAAIAAALGLGAWWSLAREAEPRQATADEAPSPPAAVERAPAVAEPLAPPLAAREAAPAAPPPPEAAEAPPAPAPARPRAAGRCVDEDLVPVAGALVRQLEAEHATEAHADGTFELVLEPRRGGATLLVTARGLASRFVDLAVPSEGAIALGDVVLAPGGRVRGRVLGEDAAPFEGARLAVTGPDLLGRSLEQAQVEGPLGERHLEGVSGHDGRFEVDGVALGPVRVWAGAEGMRYAVSAPHEVRAGAAGKELELVLAPVRGADRVRGIVLSPAGEPVPGAALDGMERFGGGGSSMRVTTGPDGRFEIAAKAQYVYDLFVYDPEDRWAPIPAMGLAPSEDDIELRFEEPRWMDVSLRTPDGEPIEVAQLFTEDDRYGEFERVVLEAGSGGRARLKAPRTAFSVRAVARGFTDGVEGPFVPEDTPGELVLELAPAPGIRGRVLAEGSPVAGARVMLHEAAHPRSRIEVHGHPSLVTPHPEDRTTTDTEGRFVLQLREAGNYVVRAEADGWAAADTEPLAMDPRVGLAELELVLGRGGALEGRVLVAPGRDPAGVIVAVNRGDAKPRTVRSGPDGSFRFEGLTAGGWHLSRSTEEVNPERVWNTFSLAKTPTAIPFNCTVRDGETTFQDLDLRALEPARLAGALRVNGSPAEGWSVAAWSGEWGFGTPVSTVVAADGAFALVLDEAGPAHLAFSPPAETGGRTRIETDVQVTPGENEWSTDWAMGRLSGRVLTPLAPGDELVFDTLPEATPRCRIVLEPAEDGSYRLPFVLAGKGVLAGSRRAHGTVRIDVDVPAGGERIVDVP